MKIFSLITLTVTIFLTGCETVSSVKHDPIPASEVRLFESKYDGLVRIPDSTGRTYFNGEPMFTDEPVKSFIGNAQYVGRIHWSGTVPELNIPESSINTVFGGPLPELPDRVIEVIKERGGKLGANLIILEAAGAKYDYRWIMEDGKLQPEFLLWGKAYFTTNSP